MWQALPVPVEGVRLRAEVRVSSGAIRIGAVQGSGGGATVTESASGASRWTSVELYVRGPADQVVVHGDAADSIIEIRSLSLDNPVAEDAPSNLDWPPWSVSPSQTEYRSQQQRRWRSPAPRWPESPPR